MLRHKLEKNIPLVKSKIPKAYNLLPKLKSILYNGIISEGKYVYKFEKAFAKKFNFKNVVALNSCTAALHIAFLLSDVGPGDEVISTSMTAEPTNTAIMQTGAMPIFADVEYNTGNISPDSIKEKISSRTKAICVVHYAGYPAKINEIKKISQKYNLKLIEDCAHAIGAKYEGKFVGSFGDFGTFSFQAIKHITTIDGGMLIIKRKSLVERAKRLRWFGLTKGIPRNKNNITELGYKYNMTNVSAVIGLEQLKEFNKLIESHKKNAKYFNEAFSNIKDIKAATIIKKSDPSYWIYTILSEKSDKIIKNLQKHGISASKLHYPNHLHSIFNKKNTTLDGLENFYRKLVHIPCGWWLSKNDLKKIVDIVLSKT